MRRDLGRECRLDLLWAVGHAHAHAHVRRSALVQFSPWQHGSAPCVTAAGWRLAGGWLAAGWQWRLERLWTSVRQATPGDRCSPQKPTLTAPPPLSLMTAWKNGVPSLRSSYARPSHLGRWKTGDGSCEKRCSLGSRQMSHVSLSHSQETVVTVRPTGHRSLKQGSGLRATTVVSTCGLLARSGKGNGL